SERDVAATNHCAQILQLGGSTSRKSLRLDSTGANSVPDLKFCRQSGHAFGPATARLPARAKDRPLDKAPRPVPLQEKAKTCLGGYRRPLHKRLPYRGSPAKVAFHKPRSPDADCE